MKNNFTSYSTRALTLVEVLGAVAVLATVATVSVISVKDTVQAGQKASAQKEIQNLNAALESFKSAGGVIPDNATAEDAVAALMRGVDLGGSEYAPLISVPESSLTIAGEPYTLAYTPEGGFSYVNDNGGDLIGGSGSPLVGAVGAPSAPTYPFDITNPTEASEALNHLQEIDPSDPNFVSYLEALNAAYAYGSISSDALTAGGFGAYNGSWLPASEAQARHTQDGEVALANGGSWSSLSTSQQTSVLQSLEEALRQGDSPDRQLQVPGSPPQTAMERWNSYSQEQKESIAANIGASQILSVWAPVFQSLGWQVQGVDINYYGHVGLWYTPMGADSIQGAAFVGTQNGVTNVDLYGSGDWGAWYRGPVGSELYLAFDSFGFGGPPPSGATPADLSKANINEVIRNYVISGE